MAVTLALLRDHPHVGLLLDLLEGRLNARIAYRVLGAVHNDAALLARHHRTVVADRVDLAARQADALLMIAPCRIVAMEPMIERRRLWPAKQGWQGRLAEAGRS